MEMVAVTPSPPWRNPLLLTPSRNCGAGVVVAMLLSCPTVNTLRYLPVWYIPRTRKLYCVPFVSPVTTRPVPLGQSRCVYFQSLQDPPSGFCWYWYRPRYPS